MKYLISFVLFSLAFLPFAVRADMIPEGQHYVENCFAVDNANQFTDYNIYLSGEGKYGHYAYLLGEDDGCSNGGEGSLFAVKKTDVENLKSASTSACPECTDNWHELAENQNLIIPSNFTVTFSSYLPDIDPTVRTVKVAHIDSITDKGMEAHLVSSVLQDSSGKTTALNVTEKAAKPETTVLAAVFIILGIAGLGLAVTAWKK